MKKFLDNIWARRAMSIFSIVYGLLLALLAYRSVFYKLVIPNQLTFVVLFVGLTLFFSVPMMLSRKIFITKLVTMCLMVLAFPIVMFWFGEWSMIIPIAAFVTVMFFACGASEKFKLIFGTFLLMYYIVGALLFYLVSSLFASHIPTVKAGDDLISTSGLYRSYIIDAPETTVGTSVYIEPNNKDIENSFLVFRAKGFEHRVYINNDVERAPAADLKIEWKTEKRAEILARLLAINPDIDVTLDKSQLKDIGKSTATKSVKLSSLTAADFVKLGIPEKGDVLYINGKAQFTFFNERIEQMFNIKNRKIVF
ncbi:MAG: hypothetical protein LBL93_06970 [Ruminococcus sp.]|jgi:hypothetical protein|nr:hypothetical protein [Ruminococcus sp.]